MSITKNRLSRNFTTLPNAIITEKISSNAFRMYCYLISKPDGWTVLNNDIKLQLNIKDDKSIAKYWKELVITGWVTRHKMINESGQFTGGYDYQLNEVAILSNEENILIGKKSQLGKYTNQEKMVKHINTDLLNKTNNINKIYLLWEKLQNKQFDKTTEQYKARINTIDRALKKYNIETISNVIEYKLTSPNTKSKELSSILGNYLDVNIQNMFVWLENNKNHITYEDYNTPKKPNLIKDAYIDEVSGNLCAWVDEIDIIEDLFCPIRTPENINNFLALKGYPLRYNDLPRRDTNTYVNPQYGIIKRPDCWKLCGEENV